MAAIGKTFSSDDLECFKTLVFAVDAAVTLLRKDYPGEAQSLDRKLRVVVRILDRK